VFVFEKSSIYGNTVVDKSLNFSVRIVNLYKYLIKKDKNMFAVYNQLLKSGTSIGANISESQSAALMKDFTNKLAIFLKESFETNYWLKILYRAKILEQREFESFSSDNKELIKLLVSIIKTSKEKLKKL
jgi:four helix bundle protein